jgi:hypothetical protein
MCTTIRACCMCRRQAKSASTHSKIDTLQTLPCTQTYTYSLNWRVGACRTCHTAYTVQTATQCCTQKVPCCDAYRSSCHQLLRHYCWLPPQWHTDPHLAPCQTHKHSCFVSGRADVACAAPVLATAPNVGSQAGTHTPEHTG